MGDAVVQLEQVALAAALLAGGCVQLEWEHHATLEAVDAKTVASLEVGHSDLGACLAALGAPLYVWEYRGDGVALGFGASRGRMLDLNVSIPLSDTNSAPFDYTERSTATNGWILFFDHDWKLVSVREGRLRDLARSFERQPPAPAED